jgi:hypothetical protein
MNISFNIQVMVSRIHLNNIDVIFDFWDTIAPASMCHASLYCLADINRSDSSKFNNFMLGVHNDQHSYLNLVDIGDFKFGLASNITTGGININKTYTGDGCNFTIHQAHSRHICKIWNSLIRLGFRRSG